jgi:hypothetical protein
VVCRPTRLLGGSGFRLRTVLHARTTNRRPVDQTRRTSRCTRVVEVLG